MNIKADRPRSVWSGPAVAHGGNLSAARRLFPDAAGPWIDLSTGINPLAYPMETLNLPASAWTRLPEPAEIERLEASAAAAYGAPDPRGLVAASGTQPLLQLLPQLLPARRVAILGFGYQEHPACWRAAGAEVRIVENVDELAAPGTEVALVVNPNNPDGRLTDAAALREVGESLAARGGRLIVDEAFMDVVRPSQSLAPRLPPGTIVLRSFGKAYGLAGLRLSFAISDPATAGQIRARLGAWPVSGPALAIGTAALADRDWMEAEIARLEAAAARLDRLLERAELDAVGGTSLFRLVRSPDAAGWFERLGRAGILVRRFDERPEWLRFGLPGPEADWRRLETALRG
ncbi:threonine-phosphate decarboxylase CobD [Ancylobacter mangrovi]|uniref:threonine-phosphate decarboxylase CobD n=1 Tax=Ancylobacter mangrovi TaxID=2972472 RepID=UPI00216228ED|nr:threonine-phosphate decarboxylase CobD [Ancylobacter mangrovi]MCS0502912.1 threonine-phosphate decarboxylase CobD [Ancylobacter mangrovi]